MTVKKLIEQLQKIKDKNQLVSAAGDVHGDFTVFVIYQVEQDDGEVVLLIDQEEDSDEDPRDNPE